MTTNLAKISGHEYADRREYFFSQLAENSIAIIATSSEKAFSNDVYYPFQPQRNFYYLTGFSEPQAVAVLIKGTQNQFILFNRAKNLQQEKWLGYFAGQTGAINDYAADQAYPIEELEKILPQLLTDKEHVYYARGHNKTIDHILACYIYTVKQNTPQNYLSPVTTHNIEPIIHEMRLLKSAGEIELLAFAAEISSMAHITMMKACRSGKFEYQLQAELSQVLQYHGCIHYPYDPIIAGGNNACILHYNANRQILNDGELILIDAAGSYDYYAADITRTFPINGKFTSEQKQLYQIVLQAQLNGMKTLKPGNNKQNFNDVVAKTITEGLVDLNILTGNPDILFAEKAYLPYYPHGAGHWLGLDVHDVGAYHIKDKPRQFLPNMVMTNEPGIYIPHGQPGVDERWHGIGIRIEDDVLITAAEPRVLSARAPKTIADIEALMAD